MPANNFIRSSMFPSQGPTPERRGNHQRQQEDNAQERSNFPLGSMHRNALDLRAEETHHRVLNNSHMYLPDTPNSCNNLRPTPLPTAPAFQNGTALNFYASDPDDYSYQTYATGCANEDVPARNGLAYRQDYQSDPASGAIWSRSRTSYAQGQNDRNPDGLTSGYNAAPLQAAQQAQPTGPSAEVKAGSIYYRDPYNGNGRSLRCDFPECHGQSFNRTADFDRHFIQLHAPTKPEFWCPMPGCPREEPFPRKDKMLDHAKTRHG